MSNDIMDSMFYIGFDLISSIIKLSRNDYVLISLSSRDEYLKIDRNANYTLYLEAGSKINRDSATYKCIKEGKPIIAITPKELFGVSLKTSAIPIKNSDGKVIGCFALGENIEDFTELETLGNATFEPLKKMASLIEKLHINLKDISDENSLALNNLLKAKDEALNTNSIISYVDTLAKQTSLIALNARIESARVESINKEFSIVANEVKKLSNDNQKALEDISEILNNIKVSTTNITSQLENSNNEFQLQVQAIQNIHIKIKEIINMSVDLQNKIKNFI